ncbi:SAM-dependent DNA methyltransferase, partial [bacterium]|nr:SAM-dependent DNA methyltransferase [bacterium]
MSIVNTVLNAPLPKPLRTQLENTVKAARDVAEKAGKAALTQLAVSEAKAPDYLSADQKSLRRKLRSHGRALSDVKNKDETQELQHLVWEVAYEHWHRMLFARFLAENNLLMWEPGAAVSLDDCRDMVDNHPDIAMGAKSQWELAGKLAARMLPQVFKPHSPVFELSFAPEHQRELERLLSQLPSEVFQASDSLGWVYQFWQAKRKQEVNDSEVKIGADELPAVTQLFTEHYMVDFLLHNSLGAWWHTRHPGQSCPVAMPYLRTLEDGSLPAGNFEGWPDTLTDFKLLDPSCGSGHFLVAAFLLLVPLRMADEDLSAMDAVDAVLAHNLHGLEIDPRCVEIAVFALALAAWRYPDENGNPLGVRQDMSAPRIACCGLKVAAQVQDWESLVPDSQPNAALLRQELRLLHANFVQAPLLGSLLDPSRSLKNDLATSGYEILKALLDQALANEVPADELGLEKWDMALSARGLFEAAQLLAQKYELVVTNVPYLGRGKQSEELKAYCDNYYPDEKNDLANVFLARCLELVRDKSSGLVQVVMPQNWLFLASYTKSRERLLRQTRWHMLANLGGGAEAFECGPGNAVNICLISLSVPNSLNKNQVPSNSWNIDCFDVSQVKTVIEKSKSLRFGDFVTSNQFAQLKNPDSRVILGAAYTGELLSKYADSFLGLGTGDFQRFGRNFWEFTKFPPMGWTPLQCSPSAHGLFEGFSHLVSWDLDSSRVRGMDTLYREQIHNQDQSGQQAWNRPGVAISVSGDLKSTNYTGCRFDKSLAVLTPKDLGNLSAIWAYCSSKDFHTAVRRIDSKIIVANATLCKVEFDLSHWSQVAAERYPNGLPKPYSDDPTQWLF